MIALDWYRSFIAVYRTGTASAAAQARFLTQPAISQHVAALESAVREPLFTRASRRMIPTEAGQTLYARIAPAMDTLDRVSHSLRSGAATERPRLRLGAPLEFFTETLLDKLPNAPFDLRVVFGTTEDLIEQLEREKLDAVIATRQLAARSVRYDSLAEERFVLAGPESFKRIAPIAFSPARRDQTEQRLAAQAWVSYSVDLPIIRRFWQQVFRRRPSFQPTLVLPNLHAVRKAVALGCGLSVLPDYLCGADARNLGLRVVYKPAPAVRNDLWLGYRKMDAGSPSIARLRDVLLGVK